ncbi:hypothetical protein Mal52_01690 [Symmachiella dynata]|uniref:Uncharacterized protein n=1 Tax=Symmachiella dynata TaxID=2527995 RepID=A0A517ZGW1_9PLAN|nr:hypothetical protein [Symmachiella dynata]QDU41716.1 hypothetical protein Mal52_01690 [Symmachiella dynata]
MLSDETLDKAPADLVSPFFAATAAVHGSIYPLQENLEFDESRAVPDIELIRNALAGWQSIADRAGDNCYELARDLHEFGHHFVAVNSGPISITTPLGGPLVGGPWDSGDLEWWGDNECEWSRVGTAPSWHHVALGVARLFLAEIQPAFRRLEDVLKRHTGDDPNTAHAVVFTYDDIVGNESILPITLRWRESDLERLRLNLERELLRAWGTWFPAGSKFIAFGDLPEEEKEQAKSGSRPAKDGRTPDQRNYDVTEYLAEHGDRDKKVTLEELAHALGCSPQAAMRTDAWKLYNTKWQERHGKCRTRSGKGRRPNVATDLTDAAVRRLAEEQAIDDRDKVGQYDRI